MKPKLSKVLRTAAGWAVIATACLGSICMSAPAEIPHYDWQGKAQSADKSKQSPPSEGEQKALAKVESAPDAAAKLAAAGEFVKKYPKSALRSKVVSYVAQEINKIQDGAQRITQLENMLTLFKDSSDTDVIDPILIDSYFSAQRIDDGFRVASSYLTRNPSDLAVLTQAAIEGVEQAKKGNPKFAQQSLQYGTKAIELIESGKKPEAFDDARWSEYQTRWLPILYQHMGLLSMMSGNKTEARAKIEKAVSLNGSDPFSYVLLGSMINEEYQQLAQQHKTLSAGPMKDTVLKQAVAKIDEVIDMYAHAVGLSEGNPAYQQLHDQILQDLQAYYKYRHGGSTEGLQQLIDKYKKK